MDSASRCWGLLCEALATARLAGEEDVGLVADLRGVPHSLTLLRTFYRRTGCVQPLMFLHHRLSVLPSGVRSWGHSRRWRLGWRLLSAIVQSCGPCSRRGTSRPTRPGKFLPAGYLTPTPLEVYLYLRIAGWVSAPAHHR